jgi:hypothetical protein
MNSRKSYVSKCVNNFEKNYAKICVFMINV